MIGVESKVVQCGKANGIGVLILRKRFAVPGDRATRLSDSPRLAAITLVVKRSIICPAGFLRRSVKRRIAYVNSRRQRYAERLNAAIEVLVVERVLVVPDALARISYFVTHEPNPVVSRIRLDLVHCCAPERLPSLNGRLHAHGGAGRRKCVVVPAAADVKPTIGGVVVHVALPWMTLAPGVFMWSQIHAFGKISRAGVLGRV